MAVSAFAARHILGEHRAVTAPTSPPVTGYTCWYDSSGITGQADNTALASWPDLSGNAHNLAQATSANQPTYYSTTAGKLVNGRPAVWFTASQWIITPAAIQAVSPTNGAWTVFWVGITSAVGGIPVSSDHLDSGGTGPGGVWGSTTRIAQWIRLTSTTPESIPFPPVVPAGPGPIVLNIPEQITAVADNSTATVRLNGAAGTPVTETGLVIDVQSLRLGYGSGTGWAGTICETLVYSSGLTGPQIASTESYLKTKWGTP